MKKLRMVLLAGLLIAAFCAPAHSWEFALTGNFEWTYNYYSQAGGNGFFGFQNEATAGLVGTTAANWYAPNFWVGARNISGDQLGVVTGLDASAQYMRMTFNPEIRINPAVRLRGQYIIGSWQQYSGGAAAFGSAVAHASSFYLNQQSGSGLTRPIDTGFWNLFWATAQTPWGILVFGKRPFGFGMGLGIDGERTLVSESLAIVAPYGPLRIGGFVYPWRQGVFLDSQRNLSGAGAAQLGQGIHNTTGTGYPKLWDASGIRLQLPQAGMFVTYSNGPLDAGIAYEHFQQHQGPEAQGTLAGLNTMPTIDESIEDSAAYVKYNNGRFFFNAEVEWWRWTARFQRGRLGAADPATIGLGSIYQPVFNEGWAVGTEFGFLCGPSKLSLLYTWSPGPDRRQGIWISNSPWNDIAFGGVPNNVALFLPYSYLLGYTYGSGLNFINARGEGGITDATVTAARLDYAVAANLNVYATGLWAWRNSGGWPWGVLTINGANTAANSVQVFGISTFAIAPQNLATAAVRAPNIPDNNLGYEFTTGADWKLLEGLTMNLRGAYWQPGEWFKFACLDRGLVTTAPAGFLVPLVGDGAVIGSSFGVNPSKSIDPIWAFTGSLNVDF